MPRRRDARSRDPSAKPNSRSTTAAKKSVLTVACRPRSSASASLRAIASATRASARRALIAAPPPARVATSRAGDGGVLPTPVPDTSATRPRSSTTLPSSIGAIRSVVCEATRTVTPTSRHAASSWSTSVHALGVEGRVRLVEQDERRPAEQDASEREALAHAGREVAHPVAGSLERGRRRPARARRAPRRHRCRAWWRRSGGSRGR